MEMTWINGSIYKLLNHISDFQNFFMDACSYLAAICIMMTIGMTCVKIFLQACDARQELIKIFMMCVYYFIMIWAYPYLMKGVLNLGMNLGYGAVFSSGSFDVEINDKDEGHTKKGFYEWMAKSCPEIFSSSKKSDENADKNYMNQYNPEVQTIDLNIVDRNTGFINFNKTFSFVFAYIKIMIKALPKWSLFSMTGIEFVVIFVFILALLAGLVSYFMCLIAYVMALVDYYSLVGFGVLFVPLQLWEGTKSYTSNLFQSAGKILIKLTVVSAFLFLSIMVFIDVFATVYQNTSSVIKEGGGGIDFVVKNDALALLEMFVTVIFQSVLVFVLSKQSTAISNFLSGGSPQLSFGEFGQAASQAVATGSVAKGSSKGITNELQNMKASVANTAGSAVLGGIAGGAGGFFKSLGESTMSNIGGSLKGGFEKGKSALTGSGLKNTLNNLDGMFGFRGAGSGEGLSAGLSSSVADSSQSPSDSPSKGNASSSSEGNSPLDGKASGEGANPSSLSQGKDSSKENPAGSSETNNNPSSSSSSVGTDSKGSEKDSSSNGSSGPSDPYGLSVYGSSSANDTSMGGLLLNGANRLANSSNAFDRSKASFMGFGGNMVQGFKSYLSDRTSYGLSDKSRGETFKGNAGTLFKELGKGLINTARGNHSSSLNFNGGMKVKALGENARVFSTGANRTTNSEGMVEVLKAGNIDKDGALAQTLKMVGNKNKENNE